MAASNLEILLNLIAQAAPGSWYPRLHAQSHQVPIEAIHFYLEHLYLDGLITRGASAETTGPGVTLTARGTQLLQDPAGLERLREGLAIDPGDRGGIVREILRRPSRPVVTWTLIALNVAVFAWGLVLAVQDGVVSPFLGGFLNNKMPMELARIVNEILHRSGSVTAVDLLQGAWWRLLTACFVHIGLIHLLSNMLVLRSLGGYTEQMWGRGRYLLLYLLSGLGGSCLAMAYQPQGCAGASGAICGLFSAEAVWMLLNQKLLPRSFVRRWPIVFLPNAGLILFISLVPGVSALGHLGGAVAGMVVALLLHLHRFGPKPWRWVGIAALVPLPWAGYALIEHARRTNPTWIKLERLLQPRTPDERP